MRCRVLSLPPPAIFMFDDLTDFLPEADFSTPSQLSPISTRSWGQKGSLSPSPSYSSSSCFLPTRAAEANGSSPTNRHGKNLEGLSWTISSIAFTKQKNFGKEVRELKWAHAQRTLHGLQPPDTKMFNERSGITELIQMAEEAKRGAEIAKLVLFSFRSCIQSLTFVSLQALLSAPAPNDPQDAVVAKQI
ncbi:hypothetical protein ZIOFF_047384 [Zingiber officinale]|uniref:Uncharacterized protein n=1 Tax=Zingiber officinale TaxID=94328 RepID=A0A8J5KJV2_ZINOF|nr:hypothetical protein ZIOFF_047384 [Zingiber officinale]